MAFSVGLGSIASAHQPSFVPNVGQWDGPFAYKLSTPGYTLFVEDDALTIELFTPLHHHHEGEDSDHSTGSLAYRMAFVQSLPQPTFQQKDIDPTPLNYLLGSDPSRWATDLRASKQLVSQQLWSNIDLILQQHSTGFEYSFLVQPGGKPQDIQWKYEGVQPSLRNGALHIVTEAGSVVEQQPRAWQIIQGEQVMVPVDFFYHQGIWSFQVGKYQPELPLYIDPVVVFSSLTGSPSDNWGFTATYDDDGNMYAGGISFTAQYPTTLGVFQPNTGGLVDISLMKFSPNGSQALYSSFLGGDRREVPTSMVVDAQGNLIMLATAASTNLFTSPGAVGSAHQGGFNFGGSMGPTSLLFVGGTDLYVAKINPAGNNILKATYIGGAGNEGLNPALIQNYGDVFRGEIIVSPSGQIIVTSTTSSTNFPVLNPAQASLNGSTDAVVMSLQPNLDQLNWSTYLGGPGSDAGFSVKQSGSGKVYVGGTTNSASFPAVTGGHQSTAPADLNGYLSKLNASTGALEQSTFVGTGGADALYLLDVDRYNQVYAVGQTNGSVTISSGTASTPGARQFVKKWNADLTMELVSSAIGSGPSKFDFVPTAFLVDDCLRIFISGWNGGSNFGEAFTGNTNNLPVTPGAVQTTTDGSDFYLATYSRNMAALEYATYFGGTSPEHVDGGTSRFSKEGIIYQAICAACGNGSFPTTPGVYGPVDNSTNCNLGAVKIDFQTAVVAQSLIDFTVDVDTSCYGLTVSFSNLSINAQVFQWDFGNGDTSSAFAPTAVFDSLGVYNIRLIAIDTICNISDTAYIQLVHDRPEKPEAGFVADYQSCDALFEAQFINTTTGGDTYEWDFGDGQTSTQQDPQHTFPGYGSYTIRMIATDTLCFTTDTLEAQVSFVDSIPRPSIYVIPNPCNNGNIEAIVPDGRNRYLYEWTLSNGAIGYGANPTFDVAGDGTYGLTVVVTDTLCNRQYTLQSDADVTIRPEVLFMPNAFTPNGDGTNEFWEIKGNTCSDITLLQVFNKWGQLIFETDKPLEEFWDGTFEGAYAPQGVYVWRMRDGETSHVGTVTLVY